MKLDDILITRAIVENFYRKFLEYTEVDVAVAGGGPAGLCASYFLAKEDFKVALFERKLSVGGGMWGGGMMFNEIVVGEEGKRLLEEFEVGYSEYRKGYYTADAVETLAALTFRATKAKVKIFNLISVEDVMIEEQKVTGLVLNWSAVEMAKLHVDPLTIRTKCVIDATGHPAEIAKIIVTKMGNVLKTKTGGIVGEKTMCADVGEKMVVENSKEFYPGVWVAGMAANAVFGAPRMGPVFGGMLLSGEKVAKELIKKLKTER